MRTNSTYSFFYRYVTLGILLPAACCLAMLSGCKQDDVPGGPAVADTLNFGKYFYVDNSGKTPNPTSRSEAWAVDSTVKPSSPDNNLFSNLSRDISVDVLGRLYMSVSYNSKKWWGTQIVAKDTVGYGIYTLRTVGDLTKFDSNLVLRMYTYNPNTTVSDANSELDLEFHGLGLNNDSSHASFTVQPYTDSTVASQCRRKSWKINKVMSDTSVFTHVIRWTPTYVRFTTYHGSDTLLRGTDTFENRFTFTNDDAGQGNRKYANFGYSNYVKVPDPGKGSRLAIAYFIRNADKYQPSGAMRLDRQVVLKDFTYKPLNFPKQP